METNLGTCFNRRKRDSDKIDRAQLHSMGREDGQWDRFRYRIALVDSN